MADGGASPDSRLQLLDSRTAMTDETFKKPPEVVCDDQGIATRLDGPLSYHIRWSEIRKIQIDVIDYGEQPTGSPAFFAPLELVGGGHELTARLRQMSGFNDAALQLAKASEERG